MAAYCARRYNNRHDQENIQLAGEAYYRAHVEELSALTKTPASQLRVADVGCSFPVFLRVAREAGANVLGIDYDQAAIARGADWQVPVVTPDQFAATDDGVFDIMRFSHTIEHLIDPVRALRTYVPKLKPGGLAVITQPNFPVMRAVATRIRLEDSKWPEHLHFFNPLSMRTLCERAGLKVNRLFSHQNAEARELKYAAAIDLSYSHERLADMAAGGDTFFGALNNWPNYFGDSITVFAQRTG
jgi:SAM-dependent methyltransferase